MNTRWIPVVVGCWVGLQAQAQPVRLALIVPTDPQVQAVADLLTAELSSSPRVALLERAEIERVQREQQLSAASVKDGLKLGQLLGAHGLLMLSTGKENDQSVLYARLVAVQPGVILRTFGYPWPLRALDQWPKQVVAHLAPLLPKLGVLVKDAVPVSILNLRSALSSADAKRLEKELTVLLVNRLSHEKEVFVLERQHLGTLEGEKDLAGLDDSPFWSGSWLLEGVLDREGVGPETLSVTARLVSPSKVSETFEVTGPRDNLPVVADQLARAVISRAKKAPSSQAWDPAAEAARYWDEARWAERWGLPAQVRWAADSAWALGLRTLDVASKRVWIRCVQGMVPQPARTLIDPISDEVVDLLPEWTPPAPGVLDEVAAGIETYLACEPSLGTNAASQAWQNTGLWALDIAAEDLRQYWFAPEHQAAAEAQLARLRKAAAELERWLLRHEGDVRASARQPDLARRIYDLKLKRGWVWADSPEEVLEEYRQRIQAGFSEEERRQFLFRAPGSPFLVAWPPRPRSQIPELWSRFCEELGRSTNPVVAVLGGLLEHQSRPRKTLTWDPEGAYQRTARRVFSKVWEHRERLLCQEPGLMLDALRAFERTPRGLPPDSPRAGVITDYARHFRTNFIHYWAGLGRCFHAELARDIFRGQDFDTNHLAVVLDLLAARTGTGPGQTPRWKHRFLQAWLEPTLASWGWEEVRARRMVMEELFRPDEWDGQELRSLVETLTRATAKVRNGGFTVEATIMARHIKALENRLPPSASVPASPAVPAPQVVPAPSAPAPKGPELPPPLQVSRWWAMPTNQGRGEWLTDCKLLHMLYRENRLWFEGHYLRHWLVTNLYGEVLHRKEPVGVIWSVNLQDFSCRSYPFPVSGLWDNPFHDFEVLNGTIYRLQGDQLLAASAGATNWQSLHISVPGGRPTVVGRRLYFSSQQALVEVDPAQRSIKTLVSIRRRPPAHPLDRLVNLGRPAVLSGGSNLVWMLTGDTIWVWDSGQGAWVHRIPQTWSGFQVFPEHGQILFLRGDINREPCGIWRLTPGREAELLFELGPLFPSPSVGIGGAGQTASRLLPKWRNAAGFSATLGPLALDGENLWTINWFGPGGTPLLYCLDERWEESIAIPLKFAQASPLPKQAGSGPWDAWHLWAAAEGLVLFPRGSIGFWFIPRPDLERFITDAVRQRPLALRDGSAPTGRLATRSPVSLGSDRPLWADEADTNMVRLRQSYDRNGDGKLDFSELQQAIVREEALAGYRPGPGEGWTSLLLITPFDRDSDGLLNVSELEAMRQRGKPPLTYTELLQRYDTNRDGWVRQAEAAAARQALKPPEVETPYPGVIAQDPSGMIRSEWGASPMQQKDRTGSGQPSSASSRTNRPLSLLERFDLNGDGILDAEERAAMRKSIGKRSQ